MAEVIWTSPGFLILETLPYKTALGIFRKTEMLSQFPQIGGPLPTSKKAYAKYRQLIYKSTHRIIYEYDQAENTAYIVALQSCKQKLPTPRELKRRTLKDD